MSVAGDERADGLEGSAVYVKLGRIVVLVIRNIRGAVAGESAAVHGEHALNRVVVASDVQVVAHGHGSAVHREFARRIRLGIHTELLGNSHGTAVVVELAGITAVPANRESVSHIPVVAVFVQLNRDAFANRPAGVMSKVQVPRAGRKRGAVLEFQDGRLPCLSAEQDTVPRDCRTSTGHGKRSFRDNRLFRAALRERQRSSTDLFDRARQRCIDGRRDVVGHGNHGNCKHRRAVNCRIGAERDGTRRDR